MIMAYIRIRHGLVGHLDWHILKVALEENPLGQLAIPRWKHEIPETGPPVETALVAALPWRVKRG